MSEKRLSLPKLNELSPTLESTALKLMEETGELAQAMGKFRGLNGEKVKKSEKEALKMITMELMDVAQTAVTMMYVLEEEYNVDLEQALQEHVDKLLTKGYLTRHPS